VQNLEITRVDAEKNLILIRGAVPGIKGALITIKSTVKV
jgi:large subunit ribosomal protein L3